MGAGRSKYYVNLDSNAFADHDADQLHSAMKGLGTDEADMIRTLAFTTNTHIQKVRHAFDLKYSAKGDLITWIKDDTSGDLQDLLVAMAQEEAEMIAEGLYKAMKGLGTDDNALIELIALSSPVQLQRAKEIFDNKYPDGSLKKWIDEDTSGDYGKVLLALTDKVGYFASCFNRAIKGAGTNDDELISLVVCLKRNDDLKKLVGKISDPLGVSNDLLTELEYDFSTPTLIEVSNRYELMYGQPLKTAIANDVSGNYKKLLLAMIEDQGERDAAAIRSYCSGMGTNDDALIQMMVTRGHRERESIVNAFHKNYSISLAEQIDRETSGNYKKILLTLAKPKSVAIAEGLHRAMKGVGTDDKALIRLLTHRTKLEIKEVCAAYSKLYDKELLDEIKSETSGWFRKALCYLIQESLESPRVYLPMGTLKKVRDVDV